jgi:ATP-dependent protease ClpP protease subunit
MKEVYIRFMAKISPQTSDRLMRIVDDKIHNGYDKIHLLISSPGGSVFHGLSLYNFLYGIPLEVATYNFGSVDSIGVILFCAGGNRYSVPNARFLIHGVSLNASGTISFDERLLDEQLKGLRIDQSNIAKIIAFTSHKKEKDVVSDIHRRITLSPAEALEYGLVTEIKDTLMPVNAEFYSIREFDSQQTSVPPFGMPAMQMPQIPVGNGSFFPEHENYTSMFDRGFTFTDSYS